MSKSCIVIGDECFGTQSFGMRSKIIAMVGNTIDMWGSNFINGKKI